MATLLFDSSTSGDAALYVATGGAPGWCAFVAAASVSPLPTSPLTFEQVNALRGFVVFAPAAPASPAALVAGVRTYAQNTLSTTLQQYLDLGLVWLADPSALPAPAAVATAFWLNRSAPNTFAMLTQTNYTVGNNFMTLYVGNNGISVAADPELAQYAFSVPELTPSATVTLTCNPYGATGSVLRYLRVPLTGPGATYLLFEVGFDAAQQLPMMDVGLKYYYPDPALQVPVLLDSPLLLPGATGSLVLAAVSFAPFALLDGSRTYFAFTGETLVGTSPTPQPTALPSTLLTDYGCPVVLLPVKDFSTGAGGQQFPGARASRFVFSSPSATTTADTWVLLPSGCYTLSAPQAPPTTLVNGQLRLLCGLAGTEAITFTPQLADHPGDQLRFSPGAPAYAPGFVPGSPAPAATGPLLTSVYQTAWVNVVSGSATARAPIRYLAQPEGASLYTPDQAGDGPASPFLSYFATAAGSLSAAPALTFPLVPYGGPAAWAPATQAVRQQFERQVLSPSRKAAIAQALAPQLGAAAAQYRARRQQLRAVGQPEAAPLYYSTSPQGLYLEVDQASGLWNRLQLAQNQVQELVNNQPTQVTYSLEFDQPGADLQSALQTNQLFLVISASRKAADGSWVLGSFATGSPPSVPAINTMSIEGWPFQFALPSLDPNGLFRNVLIFKFRSGASLLDLVQDPSQWTTPAPFNFTDATGSLGTLPAWLQNYLQSGATRGQTDADYARFAQVVTDPAWQGILGLNVDIGQQDFPEGLQGLLAGIDLTRFSAHHFGIDSNRVEAGAQPGTLQMQHTSSLFGLIDYEDRVFEALDYSLDKYRQQAPLTSADYGFTVLSLKVLFRNSKIANYSSYLALTINRLFGEKVLADNRQNLLLFAGSYEDHNGQPVYAFNSLPAGGASANGYLLQMQSPVFRSATVLKASFNTLVARTADSQLVHSVFALWGYLDLHALPGLDLLSYGSDVAAGAGAAPAGGLSFANLYIDLSFPLATPAAASYAFDISQVSFDLSQSQARLSSLASRFPVQLTGLVAGTKTDSPATQGYLNVDLPSLAAARRQPSVSGPWYGLQFNLNMGTLGALAGPLGFNATLLVAWTIGGSGVLVGLKLPGVNPQAPMFSLQGILRLNISSLLLTQAAPAATDEPAADQPVAYLLKINNIALKFLALSFPPGGSVNFFLFGNPAATASPQSLGWFAAYAKNKASAARPALSAADAEAGTEAIDVTATTADQPA